MTGRGQAVALPRLMTALWIAGVVAMALSVALGTRVAQEHLGNRQAWLSTSAEVADPGYDAARSDDLYDRSARALEWLHTWATVGGAGLLALVLGLLMRRGRPGPARRPFLRGAGALAAGLTVHALLLAVTTAATHELWGPAIQTTLRAAAPFVAIATTALAWLSRRGAARRTGA